MRPRKGDSRLFVLPQKIRLPVCGELTHCLALWFFQAQVILFSPSENLVSDLHPRTYQHLLKTVHIQIDVSNIRVGASLNISVSSFHEFGLADAYPFGCRTLRCSRRGSGCRRAEPALEHARKSSLGERLAPISGRCVRWRGAVRWWAGIALLGCSVTTVFFFQHSHILNCLHRCFRRLK